MLNNLTTSLTFDFFSSNCLINSITHQHSCKIIYLPIWICHLARMPGHVAKTVTCLATDTCLTADPGVASSIPAGTILSWRLIMKEFLRSFSSLLLIHSRRVVVSYKQKHVHKLLVKRLFKPAQEKVWLGKLTVPP